MVVPMITAGIRKKINFFLKGKNGNEFLSLDFGITPSFKLPSKNKTANIYNKKGELIGTQKIKMKRSTPEINKVNLKYTYEW